jgi:dihydrofolate reductase
MSAKLALVVAVAENGVIGRDNGLPWHISSDLKRFRALTMGKPLIMGRKTFESIGRVLPGRETIVVTRDPAFVAPDGVYRVGNLEDALALAETRAAAMGAEEIILAGGAEIFSGLFDRVDRMYITFVAAAPPGDVVLPPIAWSQWREVRRETHPPEKDDDVGFAFADFERVNASA